ncbi:MAG TPA: beta-ketoacyl-ACP synthase III [Pedomonas sp.]|uniref:beta-ketoacyl-ACP synthase III n=1 Tax=Pedomonas sp. TaxID=2976421 RepID=UPI002F3F8012
MSGALRSRVIGCGSYLPQRVVSNDELAKTVDTSDEWIIERTGIRQRHIAADEQKTSDLATEAAKAALAHAGVDVSEVGLIVVATATPDDTFPAVATQVQRKLGITHGAAFDVQAVCSGFIYALTVADAMVRAGQAKVALVIGAETFSRILDWEDRTTCVLFGDGAGAVVLRAEEASNIHTDHGVLASRLHSDGRYRDMLYVDGGPSSTRTTGFLRMKGREVFRHAVENLASVVGEVLDEAGFEPKDIDWVVPHQANRRILESTAKKLGLSMDRVVMTVDRHANTSAASVPLALDAAVKDGRIKSGDLLMLEAMGGGFTWGGALVRWG